MTRSAARTVVTALSLGLLGGCAQSCGDDAARLEPSPAEAFQMPTAVGGQFVVQIADACVGGGLSPCQTEQVSGGVEVAQTESLYTVDDDGLASVVLTATSAGVTTLSVTATFEGESAGERTATQELEVREPDSMRLTPSCETLDAAAPYLVPVDVVTSVELTLQGEGVDLFHHDVDWDGTVLVDATGLDTAVGTSPETVQLAFVTPGPQQVEMTGVGLGTELVVYERSDLKSLTTEVPASTVTEGSFLNIFPRAYVDDRVVCVSDPAEVVFARVLGGPCAFSSVDASDTQRFNDLGLGFALYGLSPGTCSIEVWVDGTELEDTFELSVLENTSSNAPGAN